MFYVEARGLSGGLALFWNDHYMIQILDSSQNYFHTSLVERRSGLAFTMTFSYGNPVF